MRKSNYWQRSSGRDHVIPMHHPNAFRFLRDQVSASILIVADFGRYSKTMANLRKDVVAPYMHVVKSFIDDNPPNPFKLRTTLLFFRGRTVRKSVCHNHHEWVFHGTSIVPWKLQHFFLLTFQGLITYLPIVRGGRSTHFLINGSIRWFYLLRVKWVR